MYRLITFLSFLLCLGILAPAHATTYYWTGSASSFWNNANNWSPAGIPGQGDRAFITSGLCRIPHGYHAHADDLYVYSGAEIIIRSNGRLYLHSSGTTPITLFGKITNKGRIYITPDINPTTISVYIASSAEFKQTSSGLLYCYDFQSTGIYVDGLLNNNGKIYLYGDNVGHDGVTVALSGILENKSAGWITLYDLMGTCLIINSTQDNSYNDGVIKIFADNANMGANIEDDFTNNGHFLIDGGQSYGLRVGVGDTFTNNDYVNVYNSQGDGLFITGNLYNGDGATLYAQNCESHLVYVYGFGTLENHGNLNIIGQTNGTPLLITNQLTNDGRLYVGANYNAPDEQIQNFGVFENLSCGTVIHTGSFRGESTSEVTNDGFWICQSTDASSGSGSFDNTGVISDLEQSLVTNISVANDGYLLNPVTSTVCSNETINDVLEGGSAPTHQINNWYTDTKYSTVAGTYNQSGNSFTIFPASTGLSTLYIEFSTASCSYRMPLAFTTPIQGGTELCGDGIDNDCDGLIDEAGCLLPQPTDPGTGPELEMRTTATLSEPKLFPNPGTGMLNVELPTDYTELEIQIFSADGSLVKTIREARAATGLAPGMYLVRVRTDAQIWPVQKWMVQ